MVGRHGRLVTLGIALLVGSLWPAGAATAHDTHIDLRVNGYSVALQRGLLQRGTNWVPVRPFCLHAGCHVTYDSAAKRADVYVYMHRVARHERVLSVDLRRGTGWIFEADRPSRKFRIHIQVHHGRVLVPIRPLVLSALHGKIYSHPQRPPLALVRHPILKAIEAANVKLEQLGRDQDDRHAVDERAVGLIDGLGWQWLLFTDREPWAPATPPLFFDEYQILFWQDDRREFLGRIVGTPFSPDQPPYLDRRPEADLLIGADLSAPPGEQIRWVAYLEPGADTRSFPELARYLEREGVGIAKEFGTRPEIGAELRVWTFGPGYWLPSTP